MRLQMTMMPSVDSFRIDEERIPRKRRSLNVSKTTPLITAMYRIISHLTMPLRALAPKAGTCDVCVNVTCVSVPARPPED